MKKIVASIVVLAMGLSLFAQGTVTTRKHRFADFTDKITKVVMSGNELWDSALRQEVVNVWNASPFEFCTREEYDRIRKSPAYYFLSVTEGVTEDSEKEGITFLTLVKGGPDEGDDKMTEVLSLPLSAGNGNGREQVFLPALVEAIQNFTLQAMESERTAYFASSWFNRNYARNGRIKRIYLSEEDLAPQVTPALREKYLDEDILLVDEDTADETFLQGTYNTLVGFVVTPEEPVPGDVCYKMLIEADTHTLYYYHKHKIGKKAGPGFLPEDLKRIAKGR